MSHEQFEDRQEQQEVLLLKRAYAEVFRIALSVSERMRRLFESIDEHEEGPNYTKPFINVVDPDADEEYPAYLEIDIKLRQLKETVSRKGVRVRALGVEFAEVEPADVPRIFQELDPAFREILADRILPAAHADRARKFDENFEQLLLLDERFDRLRDDILSGNLYVPKHRHV